MERISVVMLTISILYLIKFERRAISLFLRAISIIFLIGCVVFLTTLLLMALLRRTLLGATYLPLNAAELRSIRDILILVFAIVLLGYPVGRIFLRVLLFFTSIFSIIFFFIMLWLANSFPKP